MIGVRCVKKIIIKCKNLLVHLFIHFISFLINYSIFVIFMSFFYNTKDVIFIQIVNLISWICSMLFIFFVDKKYVPDLVDENNSSEMFKFFLIRGISLVFESLILFAFVSVFMNNFYIIKLVSLCILYFINMIYVKRIKFK